jgi:DNA repair ATPase RecN
MANEMSLKEKANTLSDMVCIVNEWLRRRAWNEKMLEDAEEEIKRLKVLLLKYNNEIIKHERKLQQLIDELKHRPSELETVYSDYQEGCLDGMALAIQKFEELLKERKVKP